MYDDDDDIEFISTKIGSCKTPSLVREENNNKIIVIQ